MITWMQQEISHFPVPLRSYCGQFV